MNQDPEVQIAEEFRRAYNVRKILDPNRNSAGVVADTLAGDPIITFLPGVIGKGDSWGTVLHLKTGRLGVDVNLEDFTTRFVEPDYLAGLKAAIDHEIEQYGLHRSEVHLDDPLVIVLRHCRDLVEKIEKSGD